MWYTLIVMREEPKQDWIQIRVSRDEKREIKEETKRQGFDSISAFFLWLFRNRQRKDR